MFRRICQTAVLSTPVIILAFESDFNAQNAREILSTLPRMCRSVNWAVQAGWNYHTVQMNSAMGWEMSPKDWSELHTFWADRLLEVCRLNRGVYVKAGQLLSTTGAVPVEYRERLAGLHDQCNPRPFDHISSVVEEELGQFSELFQDFDPEAPAAASIAQVHRAKLKNGEEVAVKVQYPGVRKAVATDLAFLLALSRMAGWCFPKYALGWVFQQLKGQLAREMDFGLELGNLKTVSKMLENRKDVRVPTVYEDFCTSKVLVMEWIDGCKLSDRECCIANGVNPRNVALTLLDAFAEMTCKFGFIHGDPHPGNIIVVPKTKNTAGSGGMQGLYSVFRCLYRLVTFQWWAQYEVVLLDHGRYLGLDAETRIAYCEMWCQILSGNEKDAVQTAKRISGDDAAAEIIPKLLHRRMTREERERVRRESGLVSFSNVVGVLSNTPQTLVECLRVLGVARHVASGLADIHKDRIWIEGSQAFAALTSNQPLPWTMWLSVAFALFIMKFGVWARSLSYSLGCRTAVERETRRSRN